MNSGLLKYWEHIGYLHDDGKPHNGDIPRWVRSAFYKSKYQELTFRGRTFEYLIVKGSPSNYDVYRRRRQYSKKKFFSLIFLFVLIVSAAGFFISDSGRTVYDSMFSGSSPKEPIASLNSDTPTKTPNPTQTIITITTPIAPTSLIELPMTQVNARDIKTPTPTVTIETAIDSVVTEVAIPTGRPTATFTPTPTPVSHSIEELKLYALELINEDRKKHGVAPVVLRTNPAAQMHAEDSLEYRYVGHWFKNGEKPYMVYTRTGGESYIDENAAGSGRTLEEQRNCKVSMLLVRCLVTKPKDAIERMHHDMMYDDAHADWGHRDAILNPKHLKVNIGIAFDEGVMATPWWTGFYQHFEGGHFVARPPQLNGTELSIRVENVTKDYYFGRSAVQVYFDPPYTEMAIDELKSLGSYCVGGGTNCELPQDKRRIAAIIQPPQPEFFYSNLAPYEVVAQRWIFTNDYLEVTANLGDKIYDPGVYTVLVWGTHIETDETHALIELSVVKP